MAGGARRLVEVLEGRQIATWCLPRTAWAVYNAGPVSTQNTVGPFHAMRVYLGLIAKRTGSGVPEALVTKAGNSIGEVFRCRRIP